VPSARFLRYITEEKTRNILIHVHSGRYVLPQRAERVFNAPYVEEINGVRVKNKDEFWDVYKDNDDLFITTIFPLSSEKKKAVLKFSLETNEWDLWFEGNDDTVDPMEYPLDGLILYYLTVIHGDIMIHASGVNMAGRGYFFSGVSGKGKTTMAKLWESCGADVIHDDRLIVRKIDNTFKMYNTPVYNDDVPTDSNVSSIYIIAHGSSNKITHVEGAVAVSLVMANCIQHNWGTEIISRLLNSVSSLCDAVPVTRLSFTPDKSVVTHILENE
jgi:hypothetical protein